MEGIHAQCEAAWKRGKEWGLFVGIVTGFAIGFIPPITIVILN